MEALCEVEDLIHVACHDCALVNKLCLSFTTSKSLTACHVDSICLFSSCASKEIYRWLK